MADLAKTLEEHSDLSDQAIAFLESLVEHWSWIADLALSDLVLWVPTWNDGGMVAVAQIRAATAPTALATDITGTFAPRGRFAYLDQADSFGRIIRARGDSDPHAPLGVEAIPVYWAGSVIAVLARHPSVAPRVAGQLESVYLESSDSIFAMIALGLLDFSPYSRQYALWDRPRVGDGIIRLNSDGVVDFASPNAVSAFRRLGLATDLLGTQFLELVRRLHESPSGLSTELVHLARGGSSQVADLSGANVTILLMSIAVPPIPSESLDSSSLILLKDVSALRSHQKQLLSKDATIREINHRVKNNLQMITSVINLAQRRAAHSETVAALKDARDRIEAIAAIHDSLSQRYDSSPAAGNEVDFDDIVDSLIDVVAKSDQSASYSRVGSGGKLLVHIATPLAMALSELLHNAQQHADAQRVEIRLNRRPSRITCDVIDDGSGMTGDPGLGLTIVKDLVANDLSGDIDFHSNTEAAGTRVTISCPVPRSGSVKIHQVP